MKPYSLTRRLLLTLLLGELAVAVLLSVAAMVYERHEHFLAFDIMLRGRADTLLGAVQDAEDKQDNVMLDGTQTSLPDGDVYQVEDTNGRLLGRSPNWQGPTPRLRDAPRGKFLDLPLGHTQFRALKIEGLRIVDPGDLGGGIPRHVIIYYAAPTDVVWRSIWRTVGFYALTSLGLVAVSGLCIFWLLHRGLAPLRDLAAQASAVAVGSWTFVPPANARLVQELVPLTVALETSLAGLERAFAQQKQFVGDAAHELKTAVAVLKSSLQLLTLKQRTAREYAQGIERCQTDINRMEEAVSRMLTLARLESGSEIQAPAIATDLVSTLLGVIEQFESMAELRRVHLHLSATEPVMVEIDPEQLQLLCANLLLNAIQHSSPGGVIRAIAKIENDEPLLAIEDEGDGIPPEDLPHVFDRFYRGDPSRSRNTGGTGLGLSICQAIAARSHATIQLTSELGKGTRAAVRFPSGSLKLAVGHLR